MHSLPPILFDDARRRKRRERAATNFLAHDFLWREAAARAEESLSFLTRTFPIMLGFGTHAFTPPPGTERLIQADSVAAMLQHCHGIKVVMDAQQLPLAENSLDAVVSLLDLHVVNDLPGALKQLWHALKPDGLLYAMLPGGETLRELRASLATADSALSGGMHARVAPFIDVRDGGALLQRAGFALPVADSELLQVSYENIFAMMDDLRGAGESNMLREQLQHFTPRSLFMEAAKHYAEHYTDAEGRITATMEFVTLTGWKPAANQQQPAKRGSGKSSLRDALI